MDVPARNLKSSKASTCIVDELSVSVGAACCHVGSNNSGRMRGPGQEATHMHKGMRGYE